MAREIGVPAMEDDVAAVATGSAYVREHLETGGLVAGRECGARPGERRGDEDCGEKSAGHSRAETGSRSIS